MTRDLDTAGKGRDATDAVKRKIEDWLVTSPAMAKECQGENGAKLCFVCNAPATKLIAPGWGGVWSCSRCES